MQENSDVEFKIFIFELFTSSTSTSLFLLLDWFIPVMLMLENVMIINQDSVIIIKMIF